jgi:hypothetical protein
MTPRQLLALTAQHRVFNGGESPEAAYSTPRSSSGQGSAGWLMAVARDLNSTKPVG